MNMLLHGIEDPDIVRRDSLAEDHAGEEEKYTLVLANPPFAGSLDYESTAKDLQQVVKTKKTELLFLTLLAQCIAVHRVQLFTQGDKLPRVVIELCIHPGNRVLNLLQHFVNQIAGDAFRHTTSLLLFRPQNESPYLSARGRASYRRK